jgi:hypothetical protein
MQQLNRLLASLSALSLFASGAYAMNWIYGAGTEPTAVVKDGTKVLNTDTTPHFWGFLQVGYQKNYGTIAYTNSGANKTPFSMLPPNLDSQSAFEVNRARLAVRGMIDKENTLNYFFMTEFGSNGITDPAGHPSNNYLTDASITYRGIPHLNIRVGQFKYPGSEEGLRAVYASEYRNFTQAESQLLLERFLPNDASNVNGVYQAAPQQSVGAFRDRGIELFDTEYVRPDTTVTVALMMGSGTGLSSTNASGVPTYYGYLAGEYLFGGPGKGYFTQSVKLYGWYQNGKRRLNNQDYTRERYGAGISYFHNGLRLGAEYIKALGMIYVGAADAADTQNSYSYDWQYKIAADYANQAQGGYLNAQYYVIANTLELLARYDYLDRLSNSVSGERKFYTTTVGLSYHFKGPTRIDFNYAFQNAKAPGNATAQGTLDNMGNVLSIQATLKF